MKNSTGIILGIALTSAANLLGVLIAILNINIEYDTCKKINVDGEIHVVCDRIYQKIGDYVFGGE